MALLNMLSNQPSVDSVYKWFDTEHTGLYILLICTPFDNSSNSGQYRRAELDLKQIRVLAF